MRNPGMCEDPCEGIWYWVYLKPHWQILLETGPGASHPRFWKGKIVPILMKHYRIKKKFEPILDGLICSMPRGRAALWEDGNAYIGHGNDAPKSLGSAALKIAISSLGLSRMVMAHHAVITIEDHEKMEKAQQQAMQKIIGKVPYK
jgi:hypothetical protein